MIAIREHLTVYQDPFYYISFPSCVTLDSGEILVSCRRALDPRYLLGDDALALYYIYGEDGVRHIAGSVLKVG